MIRACIKILPAAPEAPHISSVDFSHGVLYVRWTYGDLFTDLSHSRMLHWQVVAEGKKGSRRRFTTDVRLDRYDMCNIWYYLCVIFNR